MDIAERDPLKLGKVRPRMVLSSVLNSEAVNKYLGLFDGYNKIGIPSPIAAWTILYGEELAARSAHSLEPESWLATSIVTKDNCLVLLASCKKGGYVKIRYTKASGPYHHERSDAWLNQRTDRPVDSKSALLWSTLGGMLVVWFERRDQCTFVPTQGGFGIRSSLSVRRGWERYRPQEEPDYLGLTKIINRL